MKRIFSLSRSRSWLVLLILAASGSDAPAILLHTPGRDVNTNLYESPLPRELVNCVGETAPGVIIHPNYILTSNHLVTTQVGRIFKTRANGFCRMAEILMLATTPGSDLAIVRVVHPQTGNPVNLPLAAPLCRTLNLVGRQAVIIGHSPFYNSGNPVMNNGEVIGWQLARGEYTWRWGCNLLSSFDTFRFDPPATSIANECAVEYGDSGAAVFVDVEDQWQLAGIIYSGAAGGKFGRSGVFSSVPRYYAYLAYPVVNPIKTPGNESILQINALQIDENRRIVRVTSLAGSNARLESQEPHPDGSITLRGTFRGVKPGVREIASGRTGIFIHPAGQSLISGTFKAPEWATPQVLDSGLSAENQIHVRLESGNIIQISNSTESR